MFLYLLLDIDIFVTFKLLILLTIYLIFASEFSWDVVGMADISRSRNGGLNINSIEIDDEFTPEYAHQVQFFLSAKADIHEWDRVKFSSEYLLAENVF